MPGETEFGKLEERLEYVFKDKSLLKVALTHSSFMNECMDPGRYECYERMEFLGDAVLELMISEFLYRKMPDKREGSLSGLRAQLVCEQSLSKIAKELGMDSCIILGKGEEACGGRCKKSILCDVFESVLGAVYLDGGFDAAREIVEREIISKYEEIIVRNYKSELQEMVDMLAGKPDIEYRTLGESGPDHNKVFMAGVFIGGKQEGVGTGKSKKEAQQLAAADALEKYREKG